MTNHEVSSVQPGQIIRHVYHGSPKRNRKIAEVTHVGRCSGKQSKSFGHAFACISCYFPDESSTSRLSFAIESDDYIIGQGYPTHDTDGNRIRGYELVTEPAALTC